jgi:hypothetical protein
MSYLYFLDICLSIAAAAAGIWHCALLCTALIRDGDSDRRSMAIAEAGGCAPFPPPRATAGATVSVSAPLPAWHSGTARLLYLRYIYTLYTIYRHHTFYFLLPPAA